jgi:hypothetical protein
VEFTLTKTAEREFSLRSLEDFPDDSIVRVMLICEEGEAIRSWAFQTMAIFKISSSLPTDESEWVPVSGGIELNFSMQVDPAVMPDYFSIEPNVSGRFERFRNTMVFVPDNELKGNEYYSVTVKSGLPSIDGLVLENDYIFSFKTHIGGDDNFFRINGDISETFLPGDIALVNVICSNGLSKQPVDLKLFQFNNAQAYRNALTDYINNSNHRRRNYVFPTEGMREVYSSNEIPHRISNDEAESLENRDFYLRPSFVMLPDNLSQGWYLAQLSVTLEGKEFTAQKLIQINPLSVFATSLPNEVYFFINDTNTKRAASNAAVAIDAGGKRFSARANSNGVAHAEMKSEVTGLGILSIEHNGHHFLDIIDSRKSTERTPEEDYFIHLYTDREVYKPTDDIYIWGVVLPRTRNAAPLTNLRLQSGNSYNWGQSISDSAIDCEIPIKLNSDGTFTAHINLRNQIECWSYTINLMTGDTVMEQKRISIKDYVTPLYVFEVESPFYAWMPHRNPVKQSITATFFDGTPAKGLKFGESLITDENGYAETSTLFEEYNESWRSTNTWRPQPLYAEFVLSGVENNFQKENDALYGLYRDVMLESDYNNGRLNISTSMVDTANFKPGESRNTRSFYGLNHRYNWEDYLLYDDFSILRNGFGGSNSNYADMLRGRSVDTTVNATLIRTWFEKIETGSYYDFILKQNVKTYRYEHKEETVATYSINTVGGKGVFNNLPVNIEGSSYRMELSWNDTLGQPVAETVHLHRNHNWYDWRDTTINNYSLSAGTNIFTENQTLNFQLLNNREPESGNRNSRVFYAVSGSEFVSATVVNSTTFNHTMTNAHVPNVNISGAYFDGRYVYPILIGRYYFDSSERELDVEVTTNRRTYSPSGTATVTVTVRDGQGRVFPNAAVSLSVVDEAAFAVGDQFVDTLRSLYAYVYTPHTSIYASHVQHSLFGETDPGAKGGGDGTDALIRRRFIDNAAFLTATTNSRGVATFTFELPDNLTTWRLTAQAAGNNSRGILHAGNTKSPLVVTQPFFLTVNSLPQYVEGDDISISARCNGQFTGNPTITAKIVGNGTDITRTARSNETINLGKLPVGMYTLTVSARSGSNSDTIELPLEVVSTLLETRVTQSFNLNDIISGEIELNPVRQPIALTFYDNQYVFYAEVLDFLYRNSGSRADFRVASSFAANQLGFIDYDEYIQYTTDIFSNGLVRLLSYGETDLALSALVCAAAPELVNTGAAANRFYDVLSYNPNNRWRESAYTSEEITNSYLGLAALSQPVLVEILRLLENPVGLNREDKLRLCAALALIGDHDTALGYFLPLIEESGVVRTHPEGKISIGCDSETALSLIIMSVLNFSEAQGAAMYLMDNKSTVQTFVLELMTFLKHYKPSIEGDAVFTFNAGTQAQTVTLDRYRGHTKLFTMEQLENADFKVVSGDVGVRAYYIGSVTDLDEVSSSLNVTKSYTPVDGNWEAGSLVRVTLAIGNTDRNGFYYFEDIIPSGARYVRAGSENGWVNRSGQRINASMYRGNSITYYIRLINAGEFVSEIVVAGDCRGNWGSSERDVIVVNG